MSTIRNISTNHETTTTEGAIPVSKVEISPLNPRYNQPQDVDSLVEDIRDNDGVLQRIILRRKKGGYEVIAGSRRFHALRRMRGEDNGSLQPGECRLVDWDDERCVRAAVSENKERQDIPPYADGYFLNSLAERLENEGVKVNDDLLAERTGLSRAHINDVCALANCIEILPTSWSDALKLAPNRRSGDNAITTTHFKHVRKYVSGVSEISRDILELLEQTANEGWSARRLKSELGRLEDASTAKQTNSDAKTRERKRDPNAKPSYRKAARTLRSVLSYLGSDTTLVTQLEKLIEKLEAKAEKQNRSAEKSCKAKAKAKTKKQAVQTNGAEAKAA